MKNSKNYSVDPPKPRKTSEEIAAEVQAFLAKGGQVKEVPRGASAVAEHSEYTVRRYANKLD